MKKIFRKAFALIAISAMSIGVTSCDSDSIAQLIELFTPLIQNILMPNNSTPTQSFSGEWKAECLHRTDITKNDSWDYYQSNKDAANITINSQTCNIVLEQQQNDNGTLANGYSLYITVPSITLAGNTITNLIVFGGAFNSSDNISGTFNTNEQFYNISMDNIPEGSDDYYYACITNGKIANNILSFDYQIVAGLNAYNGSYNGELIPTKE